MTATDPALDLATSTRRMLLCQQLHDQYRRHEYDNWVVWAGNLEITIDGTVFGATMARAWVSPGRSQAMALVTVELFVAAVPATEIRPGDITARLWTDADQHGRPRADGGFMDSAGRYLPMHLVTDAQGRPILAGNNLQFASAAFALGTTGAYGYTVELSADLPGPATKRRWVTINEMADNRNGVVVVSPDWVRRLPTVTEVCARKVGARQTEQGFESGRLRHVTDLLPQIPTDIVYLLPFFLPGCGDLHSGKDVRKGTLGSVYAVKDFFAIDPALVTPPEEADLAGLIRDGLISDADLAGTSLAGVGDLAALTVAEAISRLGRDRLVQVIGYAELRQLTRQAHALGKRVIFDLVLMQTSRDNPLIRQHPEYYLLDENGVPRIHQIAWLVYSDVALFDLVFNQPLQEYLLTIAPHWISSCGLDGVRIDASQTIDRPFLRRLKNRINAAKPEALVLGETLCPLEQALDVPVDMVYALLVDFHRDMQQAAPLIDFLEEMHRRFAPSTVAMAYFENHDSPRATQVWRDRFASLLATDQQAAWQWRQVGAGAPLQLALLKNVQATLINLSAGLAAGANLAGGFELGSWWGETTRTDFENPTLLDMAAAGHPPKCQLSQGCAQLLALAATWTEVRDGAVYYHRHTFAGGDPDDRVLAYCRHTAASALLFLHNLDPVSPHQVTLDLGYLDRPTPTGEVVFDSYHAFSALHLQAPLTSTLSPQLLFALQPLQSLVVRLTPTPAQARAEQGNSA